MFILIIIPLFQSLKPHIFPFQFSFLWHFTSYMYFTEYLKVLRVVLLTIYKFLKNEMKYEKSSVKLSEIKPRKSWFWSKPLTFEGLDGTYQLNIPN